MGQFFLFLHAVGAVGMGIYLVMPFLVGRIMQLSSEGQAGFADGLIAANRVAQFCLALQLLTGLFLMTLADYSVLWTTLTLILMVGIGALGGVLTKPLKAIVAAAKAGENASDSIARVRLFSVLLLVLYVAIIFVMQYPHL
ncbi:MAG: hypothetical protein A9Z00_07270 [Thermobacillus sp. ZCTH02-B1]|uniref:hypothetical protein n=1 Tax=Thermobacillus sp. ZCTH02-B1 TaxID=1858795 RepID=UPI000B55C17C|nr:hypothetical protein [Thermobacillus sp. ZCTH02-B1]OUM96128.1 MAG: hypothetical protein A9Z00_07270 [Thermobacillus sp. ZCTH02-B1]